MKHVISKDIEFCFGHRVHCQVLDAEFSIDTRCCCRHCHGHQGAVKIVFEAEQLNAQQMVVDFKATNWLRQFIDEYIDHRFIIDTHDPLYNRFADGSFGLNPVFIEGVVKPVGYRLDLGDDTACYPIDDPARCVIEGVDREWYESFFVVDFCPTSENLSKWIYGFASEKMARLAKVVQVDWCETPKTRASYCR